MAEQRRLIAAFNEQLMDDQIARDQHFQNMRGKYDKIRGKKCTNCGLALHRGHFHVVGSGHSVCCTCVAKVQTTRGVKSVFEPMRLKRKGKR